MTAAPTPRHHQHQEKTLMNWQHHGTAPRATQTTTDRMPDRRPVSHRVGSRPGMKTIADLSGAGQVRAAVTR